MGFVAAAGIVGAATIGSSVVQSNAASKAAKQQANAANAATAEQQQMFDTSQKNLAPFISQGNDAAAKVSQLEGLNGGDSSTIMNALASLPGYQFANTQGLKSVQNSATARGLGISGAAQKGAADYSTGLANQYYNNLLTGVQNTETTGANAAAGLATNATQTGANIAGTIQNAGNAGAAGTMGSANAISNGLIGGANGLQNAFYANKILGGGAAGANGIYQNINADGAISNSFENAGGGFTNFAGGY